MRRQKGITLSGFMMWAVLLIVAALIAFRIGPPYAEFLSIQAQLRAVANDPEGRSGVRRIVEDLFSRRAQIENISAISGKDIQITKVGDRVVLTAEYSVCVPFVFNIRACMDYTASSGK
jgi:hypothetical protein